MNKRIKDVSNKEIRKIFVEDQLDRKNIKFNKRSLQFLKGRDELRRKALEKLLKKKPKLVSAEYITMHI